MKILKLEDQIDNYFSENIFDLDSIKRYNLQRGYIEVYYNNALGNNLMVIILLGKNSV